MLGLLLVTQAICAGMSSWSKCLGSRSSRDPVRDGEKSRWGVRLDPHTADCESDFIMFVLSVRAVCDTNEFDNNTMDRISIINVTLFTHTHLKAVKKVIPQSTLLGCLSPLQHSNHDPLPLLLYFQDH